MTLALFITPLSPLILRGGFQKNRLLPPSYPGVVGAGLKTEEPNTRPSNLRKLTRFKSVTNHMSEHSSLPLPDNAAILT
jgi:hypothetical protein